MISDYVDTLLNRKRLKQKFQQKEKSSLFVFADFIRNSKNLLSFHIFWMSKNDDWIFFLLSKIFRWLDSFSFWEDRCMVKIDFGFYGWELRSFMMWFGVRKWIRHREGLLYKFMNMISFYSFLKNSLLILLGLIQASFLL